MGLNYKGWVMEFVGTFALCFVGGLVVQSAKPDAIEPVALAHGFVLGFMIYAGANVSGSHFNPAVSVTLIILRKCPVVDGLLYIIFQLIGSILAGLLVAVIIDPKTLQKDDGNPQDISYCGCPNGIGFQPKDQFLYQLQGAGIETLSTFFLMFTIMGTAVDKRAAKSVYGFAIGATLSMCIIACGPATGGALNPFRSWGPIIGAGFLYPQEFHRFSWIYAFPFIGAILAGLLYECVFNLKEKPAPQKAKLADADSESNVKL